jgi:hypothetical protein
MRAARPRDVYKRVTYQDQVTGRGLIVAPDPLKENIEVVGSASFALANLKLLGGSVGIRMNECRNFRLTNIEIAGMSNWMKPDGEWADDGHGIQVINSGGLIQYCWPSADPHGYSEDLINVWGDKPETENLQVIIEMCHPYGHSMSDTCTHVCIDGPHPPQVIVRMNRGIGARCFLTVAGGNGHQVTHNESYGSTGADCYVVDYYKTGRVDNIVVKDNTFPRGVLVDADNPPGRSCVFQGLV